MFSYCDDGHSYYYEHDAEVLADIVIVVDVVVAVVAVAVADADAVVDVAAAADVEDIDRLPLDFVDLYSAVAATSAVAVVLLHS